MDRTGIRITVVNDGNVPAMDIQGISSSSLLHCVSVCWFILRFTVNILSELPGARSQAFGMTKEPEWELSVLSACRNFNLHEIARLLGTEVPKPTTFGENRTGLY